MSGEVPDQYWKSLLQLTTKVSAESGSGDAPTQPKAMDDDNRVWLETMMKDLVKETDPGRQLDATLEALHCYAANTSPLTEEDEAKVEGLGYRLQDLLGYTDLTSTFMNKGGLLIIERFMMNTNTVSLKMLFAEAVLIVAENNTIAQQAIVEQDFLPKLLKLLQDTSNDKKFRLKLLGAISGAVRSFEPAFQAFVSASGPSILSSVALDTDSQLAAKAIRVLTSIAFTMQDIPLFSKSLYVDICKGYASLVEKSVGSTSDITSEMEYIRDFIAQYVTVSDIPADVQAMLIGALKAETHRDIDKETSAKLTAIIAKFSL